MKKIQRHIQLKLYREHRGKKISIKTDQGLPGISGEERIKERDE